MFYLTIVFYLSIASIMSRSFSPNSNLVSFQALLSFKYNVLEENLHIFKEEISYSCEASAVVWSLFLSPDVSNQNPDKYILCKSVGSCSPVRFLEILACLWVYDKVKNYSLNWPAVYSVTVKLPCSSIWFVDVITSKFLT